MKQMVVRGLSGLEIQKELCMEIPSKPTSSLTRPREPTVNLRQLSSPVWSTYYAQDLCYV